MLKKLKLVRENSGKLAATSTIALLGFGLANQTNVHADEVTAVSTPTEPGATTSTTVDLVPTTVAEANALVVNAQAGADSASEAFSEKESQVASQSETIEVSTSEVATLEEQLASALAEHSEAVAIKSEGSSEHISELASQVASVTETYTSESAVNAANQSAADSQSVTVSSASTAASEANRSASEAATKVDELISLVASPEKVSTNLLSAKAEVSRLEREVSAAEKAVISATTTAKANLAKKLAEKQEELSQKQTALNKLKSDQTTAKVASVTGSNRIVLPSTYKTVVYPALKTIENSGWTYSSGYNQSASRLKNQIESGVQSSVYGVLYNGNGVNSYKSIAADKTRYIDPNNLSTAVQNEMAQFTGELLNDVRSQLGLATLTVTKTAQEMAAAIANEYRRSGYGRLGNAHNPSIIGKHAQNRGLLYSDNRGYESLGFFGNAKTVDQLKNYFYNSIVYMLFNDVSSNYGHTISLLQNSNNGPYYLGVSSTSNAQHIYVIPSANVKSSRFNTTSLVAAKTVDNSAQISAVKSAMTAIQSEIDSLKAQQSTIASSTLVVRAKDKLKKLNQQLSTSRDNYKTLSTLKTTLAANKSKLRSQLEEAKQLSAVRLQEKLIAQDNLTRELKKYQVLQAATTESKASVASLKERIAKLSKELQKFQDPELVSRTAATVKVLKDDLQTAKAGLEVNVKALQLLQNDLQSAAKSYGTAKENLENAKSLLKTLISEQEVEVPGAPNATSTETETDAAMNKAIVPGNVPTFDGTNKVIPGTPVASQMVSKADMKTGVTSDDKAMAKSENHHESKASSLPKTGDNTSARFILTGIGILGMAGLVVKRKNN
ncbi:SEC10/PgrA surface exclusion domain-containing protein [Streptococcus halotolerans]|uniref:SEC10/PgrA surface exclusion domain-containing protein n=1 Tax=Streptococcus halotolerans TaxID=1814128 RepID=UPI0009EEBF25|nr:SEC10/PgrA surface exclusion domain-containing protein [Streptococcus halotolerans]